ncbi:MAG TPA: hypothetical protein VMM60_05060 [Ilumatobacter sp.]|nr:hypothetical protein [Ilumatobacter sp.]
MPYTLTKGLGWFVLALLVGIVIGWLLRSVAATRQMRRLRAVRGDHSELDRMRARNANLEPLVAERDRLAAELAVVKAATGQRTVVPSTDDVSDPTEIAVAEAEIDAAAADDADATEPITEPIAELVVEGLEAEGTSGDLVGESSAEPIEFAELNLVAAAAVIGKKIKLDELTVVEGIGPAIAGLCTGIGIHTWAELATTEVSLLRTMLSDAGPRFQKHDPTSWPQQAGLLAAGQWEEFKTLTESLRGGTASE